MALIDSRRLMKADSARNLGSKVVFNYDDLNQRCQDQIAEVRKYAEQILQETQLEAERIRQEAHEVGYRKGYESGINKAEEIIESKAGAMADAEFQDRLELTLPLFQNATQTINVEHERWLAHWETTAITLAAAIAQKILGQAILLKPDLCLTTAREALKLAAGKTRVSISLNPEDIQLLGPRINELSEAFNWAGTIPVQPDPEIGRGGCLIKTEHGEIDARLETQIDRIVAELMG